MTINGNEYTTPELTFSNVCKLESWGIQADNMGARPLGLLAGFVSLAIGGKTLEDGEAAIDAHIAGGGKLDDITAAMNEALNSSGFFKALAGETAKT